MIVTLAELRRLNGSVFAAYCGELDSWLFSPSCDPEVQAGRRRFIRDRLASAAAIEQGRHANDYDQLEPPVLDAAAELRKAETQLLRAPLG